MFYPKVKFDKEMCHDLIPLSIETPLLTVKQGINSALLLSILLSGFDFFLLKSLNPIRMKKEPSTTYTIKFLIDALYHYRYRMDFKCILNMKLNEKV